MGFEAYRRARDLAAIEARVDLEQAVIEWAAEAVLPARDNYWLTNWNYYVYSHPARGFLFIPNDLDQAFPQATGEESLPTILPPRLQHPADVVMADAQWRRRYLDAVGVAISRFDVEVLEERIDLWWGVIGEAAGDNPFRSFDEGYVEWFKRKVRRHAKWLWEWEEENALRRTNGRASCHRLPAPPGRSHRAPEPFAQRLCQIRAMRGHLLAIVLFAPLAAASLPPPPPPTIQELAVRRQLPDAALEKCSEAATAQGVYGVVHVRFTFTPRKPVAFKFVRSANVKGALESCVMRALRAVKWGQVATDKPLYFWHVAELGRPAPLPINTDRLLADWRKAKSSRRPLRTPLPPDVEVTRDGCLRTSDFTQIRHGLRLWMRAAFGEPKVRFPDRYDAGEGLWLTLTEEDSTETEDGYFLENHRIRLCAEQVDPVAGALREVLGDLLLRGWPSPVHERLVAEFAIDESGAVQGEIATCGLGLRDETPEQFQQARESIAGRLAKLNYGRARTGRRVQVELVAGEKEPKVTTLPLPAAGFDPLQSETWARCRDAAAGACLRPAGFAPVKGSLPAVRACLEGAGPSVTGAPLRLSVRPTGEATGGVDSPWEHHWARTKPPAPVWLTYCLGNATRGFRFEPSEGGSCHWQAPLPDLVAMDDPHLNQVHPPPSPPEWPTLPVLARWGDPRLHHSSPAVVALSPDGKVVATGSQDRTVRLWDASTGALRLLLPVEHWVFALAFSDDGRRLAVMMSQGGQLTEVYEVATGRRLARLPGVEVSRFSTDGRHLVREGHYTHPRAIWDASSGELVWEDRAAPPAGPLEEPNVLLSPDARWAVSSPPTAPSPPMFLGGRDRGVPGPSPLELWRMASVPERVIRLAGTNAGGMPRFNSPSTHVAALERTQAGVTLRVYDLKTQKLAWAARLPAFALGYALVDSGEQVVVYGREEIALMDREGALAWKQPVPMGKEQHGRELLRVVGPRVLLGRGGTLHVFHLKSGEKACQPRGQYYPDRPLPVDRTATRLARALGTNSFEVLSLQSCAAVTEPRGTWGTVSALSISPDGARVAIATESGAVEVRDGVSREVLWRREAHDPPTPAMVDFSADGSLLLVLHREATATRLAVHEPGSGEVLRSLELPYEFTTGIAAEADLVYSQGRARTEVWRWTRPDFGHSASSPRNPLWLNRAAVSADGRRAIAELEKSHHEQRHAFELVEVATQKVLQRFGDRPFRISARAWSPDERWVVTGDDEGEVRLWDAKTGKVVRVLEAAMDLTGVTSRRPMGINDLTFSRDGRRVASSNQTGWVTVHDLEAPGGGAVHSLIGDHDRPMRLAFSPDGKALWVGTGAGAVRVLQVAP